MPFFYSICSSSKGCCTYIQGDLNKSFLVDAGISFRKLKNILDFAGLDFKYISGIFITHEHNDHIKGLASILRNIDIPIYSNLETIQILRKKIKFNRDINFIPIDESIDLFDMNIISFPVPHDAVNTHGYRISFKNGKKFGICTDLGHINKNVYENLKDCEFILLESNYDFSMLHNNLSYPRIIKNRIDSGVGHLSNDDCSDFMINLIQDSFKHFFIGHISEENNDPEIVYSHIISKLSLLEINLNQDYKLDILESSNSKKTFFNM